MKREELAIVDMERESDTPRWKGLECRRNCHSTSSRVLPSEKYDVSKVAFRHFLRAFSRKGPIPIYQNK